MTRAPTKLQMAAAGVLLAWPDYDDNPDQFIVALRALRSALPERIVARVDATLADRHPDDT